MIENFGFFEKLLHTVSVVSVVGKQKYFDFLGEALTIINT